VSESICEYKELNVTFELCMVTRMMISCVHNLCISLVNYKQSDKEEQEVGDGTTYRFSCKSKERNILGL
jgi:hypothetical protein